MRVFRAGGESRLPSYKNLEPLEEAGTFLALSKKEEQLRWCDRLLTCLLTGFLLICFALTALLTLIMAEAQTDISQFANTEFAAKVYDTLRTQKGNVFFSPYSLQVALAMTYAGASGNTAKEIQKVLALPDKKETMYKAVKSASSVLKSSNDVTLNIANGMFAAQDYPIKDAFVKDLAGVFNAQAKAVNFGDSSAAAKEINGFVDKSTNGKIPELFTPDAFTPLTKLVLVNAVYFKGAWVNKFDPTDTFKGDFFLNSKDKIQVDYMTITKKFNVTENDALKANIVEIPYQGELSMVLIVPNEVDGIKHLESHLHKVNLKTLTDRAYSQEVHLTMPKFKLEQKLELVDPLKKVGIKDMFDSTKADFGGISDKKDLYVSKVVQKAYIEVNEEGSEAAAATAFRFVMRMMPPPPLEIHVKGPFLFLLRHAEGPILFAGRVSSP